MRTDLMYEAMLVGVAALAIGCGSGPITGDDEIGETSEADESETDGDATETDGDATGTDDAETGDGDGDGDAECITAQGTLGPRALRLDSANDRAWLVGGDGDVELAFEGPPADDTLWLVGAASDTTVAVARSLGQFGQDQQTTFHVYDRPSGALAWTGTIEGGTSQLWVSDDGWVTAALSPTELSAQVGYAATSEQAFGFSNPQPLAAAAEGWLASRQLTAEGNYGPPGWLALADQTWTPADPPPSDPYLVRVADDDLTIEFMADGGLGPTFVRATPDGSQLIDLPNDQLPSSNISMAGAAGEWRLLQVHDPNDFSSVFLRIDVEAGTVEVIDPEPPPGWEWFDCYQRNAGLDVDGTVLFELRDSARARAWAFEPETAQWSEVGLPLGTVDDIEFVGHFGTVHGLRGAAQFTTFCPQTMWDEPPADALVGDSIQVLRRLPTPLAIALPALEPWTLQVDGSERCVAYVGELGWEVMALETQQILAFDGPPSTWLWLD